MAKLPRRVMSMSKRADKLASDMRDLLQGEDDEASVDASSAPTEEERPPAWAYVGAWIAGVTFLLVVVLGTRLIFTIGTGAPDMVGVQTRTVVEAEYQAARDALREPTPTPATTTSAPVSPPHERSSDTSSIPAHYHPPEQGTATVGGTKVPELECEEDEVIGFFGVPDTLACIHIDSFRVAPR